MNDVNTKNDTINRQAAIDALKRISFSHRFEYGEYLSEDTREIEIINSNKALEAIEALPSVQPEKHTDKHTETHASDLISRQALCEYALNQKDKTITVNDIMRFPSVQPEPPWVPITVRLPEEPGVYTVTNDNYEVVRYTFSGSDTSREYWERCVKAWLPLPKPYVED